MGERIEDIVDIRRGRHPFKIQDLPIQLIHESVPVVVAFTKFDQVVRIGGGS